jgi:hypothetical protein
MNGIETAITQYVYTILPAFVSLVIVVCGVIGVVLVAKR